MKNLLIYDDDAGYSLAYTPMFDYYMRLFTVYYAEYALECANLCRN